jgi:hypothetical protein
MRGPAPGVRDSRDGPSPSIGVTVGVFSIFASPVALMALLGDAAWAFPRWLRWIPQLGGHQSVDRRLPVDRAPVPAAMTKIS